MSTEVVQKVEGPETEDDIIDRLERKYRYKNMSITLSEEEWFILEQVSTMTGLNKMMLFRTAINQLMREILTKRQLDKKVGKSFFSSSPRIKTTKVDKRGKIRSCSAGIPEKYIHAIDLYAKTNRLKIYEAYSKVIDEFLLEVQNSTSRHDYPECPKDALRRSISMFEPTLQGLKALKKRDGISAYQVIYNAVVNFVEKNNLLAGL